MQYDQTFPLFAGRMIRMTAAAGAILSLAGFVWQGFWFGLGIALGSAFQIGFLCFLLLKDRQWEQKGKDPLFIGRRLTGFAMLRLVLEILLCVAVVFTPVNIIGFLIGLLSLTAMTVLDKVVSVIKE
jgi:hypothetical protein